MTTGLLLIVAALCGYAGYQLRSPERRAAWWNGLVGNDDSPARLEVTPDAQLIGDAIETWHPDPPSD